MLNIEKAIRSGGIRQEFEDIWLITWIDKNDFVRYLNSKTLRIGSNHIFHESETPIVELNVMSNIIFKILKFLIG